MTTTINPSGSGADGDASDTARRAERGAPARLSGNTVWNVIDLIRRDDGISRTELAQRIGLSVQGISKVVGRLLEVGLVVESGRRVSGGVGKFRTRLSIVAESRYALGAHLDRGHYTVSLVDLSGRRVGRVEDQFGGTFAPEEAVSRLADGAESLLLDARVEAAKVIGCGLGMAGPLDHFRGLVTAPNNFFGWHNVPLAAMMSTRLHMPVKLDKNTNLLAMAEQWRAPRSEWLAMVYVGTGIGAGLVLDGSLYRGSSSTAGEFGHMVLDPAGPECVCGRFGCVEVLASPAAVVERYRQRAGTGGGAAAPGWGEGMQDRLRDVVRLAARGDGSATFALAESGRLLGIAAGNLVTLLDVDSVVLAGPMLEQVGSLYVGGVETGLRLTQGTTGRPVRFTVSDFPADAIDIGAALLMFSEIAI